MIATVMKFTPTAAGNGARLPRKAGRLAGWHVIGKINFQMGLLPFKAGLDPRKYMLIQDPGGVTKK